MRPVAFIVLAVFTLALACPAEAGDVEVRVYLAFGVVIGGLSVFISLGDSERAKDDVRPLPEVYAFRWESPRLEDESSQPVAEVLRW